ncbi:hypothetical protein ACLB1G_06170 [Oxalobacteraceae bacterium A2-2]
MHIKTIAAIAATAATVASFGAHAQTTPTPVDTPPVQNDVVQQQQPQPQPQPQPQNDAMQTQQGMQSQQAMPTQQNDAGKLPTDQNVTRQQERTVTQPGMQTRADVRAEVSNKNQPSHVLGETRTGAPDSTVNGSAGAIRTAKKDGQPEVR